MDRGRVSSRAWAPTRALLKPRGPPLANKAWAREVRGLMAAETKVLARVLMATKAGRGPLLAMVKGPRAKVLMAVARATDSPLRAVASTPLA